MFTAFVLFCTPLDGCTLVQDTRGPYRDEAECVRRVEKMRTDLKLIHPTAIIPKDSCEFKPLGVPA